MITQNLKVKIYVPEYIQKNQMYFEYYHIIELNKVSKIRYIPNSDIFKTDLMVFIGNNHQTWCDSSKSPKERLIIFEELKDRCNFLVGTIKLMECCVENNISIEIDDSNGIIIYRNPQIIKHGENNECK